MSAEPKLDLREQFPDLTKNDCALPEAHSSVAPKQTTTTATSGDLATQPAEDPLHAADFGGMSRTEITVEPTLQSDPQEPSPAARSGAKAESTHAAGQPKQTLTILDRLMNWLADKLAELDRRLFKRPAPELKKTQGWLALFSKRKRKHRGKETERTADSLSATDVSDHRERELTD